MKLRVAAVLGLCAWLAGCAGLDGTSGTSQRQPPFRDPAMSVQEAGGIVVAGKSTKAEVATALGPATAVKFDSGFEVWVYRGKPPAGQKTDEPEFIVLFDPAGTVKKTRIRPAYPTGEQP
jgi:hypothetical protein